MTSDNLNIVLTNSLCCISAKSVEVAKLLSIGSKCSDSELQKLKLMNDWFDALRCYDIDPITALFLYRTDTLNYENFTTAPSNVLKIYTLIVNGITYSFPGDGVSTRYNILLSLLAQASSTATVTLILDPDTKDTIYGYFYIEAPCDVKTIVAETTDLSGVVQSSFDFTLYREGMCVPTNCLSEDNFNIILANLMKECDICECQLNQ